MNKTQLFPPEINPVRIGIYEVKMKECSASIPLYSWWNGYFWCNVVASRSYYVERSFSKIRKSVWIYDGKFIGWRGLANKPT